jgi:subtilisin family serine protease
MPRLFLTFLLHVCAAGLLGCDDSPRAPNVRRPTDSAKDADPPHAESTAEENSPGQPPAVTKDRPEIPVGRACAADAPLALGNAYTSLECLPQLDEINYWQVNREWAEYDDVPVTIAVLDLSFLVKHPDISNAIDMTWNFLTDGCAQYASGKNTCEGVAPTVPTPPPAAAFSEEQIKLVHGTMIAGLIAGRGKPNAGVVGVNPSARLDLFVRDMYTDNLAALRFAVERRVDVISMSWPLGAMAGDKDVPEFKALLETATKQGTVVVMAAGNSHVDVDKQAVYPTRYSTVPGVIAVGSVDSKGEFFAQFSNYGPTYVDLGAPGTAATSGGDFQGGNYSVQIGSSYSGPLVAAAVSRVIQYLKSKDIAYSAADVEQLVVEGSKVNSKLVPYFKDGRQLDMAVLLAHLKEAHP